MISNPATNGIVLSGEIGNLGDTEDNAYHVRDCHGLFYKHLHPGLFHDHRWVSRLAFQAMGAKYTSRKPALSLTNLLITDNFANNFGGGVFIDSTGETDSANYSSPSFTNVTISNNEAARGGGMATQNGNPVLTNVTFSGNLANAGAGGGMNNHLNDEFSEEESTPQLTNVTFSGNTANGGGGFFNSHSNPMLTNVTFSGT